MRRRAGSDLISAASSFVGRNAELAALRELFVDAPQVTLLGPGGMGKTRLAVQYAADLRARGRDVWFVDLSSCRNVASAMEVVARALRASVTGLSREDLIAEAIGGRMARLGRVLVVLDNFEQFADEGARFVAQWVRAAPKVQLLVTSRRVLGIDGERVFTLGPLDRAEAADLFVARARAVRPEIELDPALVGAIVDRIDRMPLPIELAASRVRVLSLEELRARLERPLGVLRSARPDERHGSVRRAVHDSLELLSPNERRLFTLAAVLRNGFTLRDAELIFAEIFSTEEVLDGLDALVRTSLLRAHFEAGACARYGYYETIREVAEELADDERETILARHSRHHAAEVASGARLEEDALQNLLLAHETAVRLAIDGLALDRANDAVALVGAIESLRSVHGSAQLRDKLFDATLAALVAVDGATQDARARAHLGRGAAQRELGATDAARTDFDVALRFATDAKLDGLRAVALMRQAAIDDVESDTARSRARLEEALQLLAQTPADDLRAAREAEASLQLGHACRREGRLVEAERAVSAACACYRGLRDDEGLAASLYELAVIDIFAGRGPEAFAHVDEGLAVARRGQIRWMEGTLTMARGSLLQERGELGAARAHHADAAQCFAELGNRHREASALFYLATTYVETHQPVDALAILDLAAARIATVRAPRYEALIAACAATAHALAGSRIEADQALARAEDALARVPHEPALSVAVATHRSIVAVRAGSRDATAALAEAEPLVAENSNDDSRFALRVLRGLVDGAAPAVLDVLVVWPNGSAFRAPGSSERVVLPARSPLRRVLEHLVQKRVEAPGEVVEIDELVAAGWPQERMGIEAALNRVYVAIATLRKRGLGEVLRSVDGGYAISAGA